MFKSEVMENEISKKAYVAPKMTVIECQGPNVLLNGSESVETDATVEYDGEMQ